MLKADDLAGRLRYPSSKFPVVQQDRPLRAKGVYPLEAECL